MMLVLIIVGVLGKDRGLFEIGNSGELQDFLEEFKAELRVVCVCDKEVAYKLAQAGKELERLKIPIKLGKTDRGVIEVEKFPAVLYYLKNSESFIAFTAKMDMESFVKEFRRIGGEMNVVSGKEDNKVEVVVLGAVTGKKYKVFEESFERNSHQFRFAVLDLNETSKGDWFQGEGIYIVTPRLLTGELDEKVYFLREFDIVEDIEGFLERNAYTQIEWLEKEREKFLMEKKKPLGILIGNFDPVLNPSLIKHYAFLLYRELLPLFETEFEKRPILITFASKEEFIQDLEEDFVNMDSICFYIKDNENRYILRERDIMQNRQLVPVNIYNFIKAYLGKDLDPYIKSGPIPTNSYENRIRIAVGTTFKEIVMKNDTNQAVVIYSPYDSTSIETLQILEEIMRKYHFSEPFEIVKIDGSLNTVPSVFPWKSLPTLYTSRKNKKNSPVLYPLPAFSMTLLQNFIRESLDIELKEKRADL